MTKRNAFFITLISLIISSCDTNKQNTDSTQSNESMFIDAPKIQKKLAPSNAKVFFLKPSASETISGPVKVEFGVDNIEIVPSGQDTPLSGHHHIIINSDLKIAYSFAQRHCAIHWQNATGIWKNKRMHPM